MNRVIELCKGIISMFLLLLVSAFTINARNNPERRVICPGQTVTQEERILDSLTTAQNAIAKQTQIEAYEKGNIDRYELYRRIAEIYYPGCIVRGEYRGGLGAYEDVSNYLDSEGDVWGSALQHNKGKVVYIYMSEDGELFATDVPEDTWQEILFKYEEHLKLGISK